MNFTSRRTDLIHVKFFLLFLVVIIIISGSSKGTVSRRISFDMQEENDFLLVKSRTYTGDEASMIRKQLDYQFGNSDGYLNQAEVDAFVASYDNYLEQTNYIIIDEILVIKQNASVNYTNLVGATADNSSIITTTFTFDAEVPHLIDVPEHYIKFNRELWKYVDLQGNGQYTEENNLTVYAPPEFKIVRTWGLLNQTYSSGNKSLSANPDMQTDWVTVKISKGILDGEPSDNGPVEESDPLTLIGILAIIVILIFIILIFVFLAGRRGSETKDEEPFQKTLSPKEVFDLENEKNQIKKEILKVRTDLRMNALSKETARSKEGTLKSRLKDIQKELDKNKKLKEKQGK